MGPENVRGSHAPHCVWCQVRRRSPRYPSVHSASTPLHPSRSTAAPGDGWAGGQGRARGCQGPGCPRGHHGRPEPFSTPSAGCGTPGCGDGSTQTPAPPRDGTSGAGRTGLRSLTGTRAGAAGRSGVPEHVQGCGQGAEPAPGTPGGTSRSAPSGSPAVSQPLALPAPPGPAAPGAPGCPLPPAPQPPVLPVSQHHGAPRAGTSGAGREKEGPGLTVEVPVVVLPPLPTRRRRCAPGPARAAPLYRGGAGTARSPRGLRPAPAPAPPAPPPAPAPAPAPAPPATPGSPPRTASTWHRPQPRTAGVMTGTGSTGGTGISGTSAAPALASSRAARHSCCTGSTGSGSAAAPEPAPPAPAPAQSHRAGTGHSMCPPPLLGPLS